MADKTAAPLESWWRTLKEKSSSWYRFWISLLTLNPLVLETDLSPEWAVAKVLFSKDTWRSRVHGSSSSSSFTFIISPGNSGVEKNVRGWGTHEQSCFRVLGWLISLQVFALSWRSLWENFSICLFPQLKYTHQNSTTSMFISFPPPPPDST